MTNTMKKIAATIVVIILTITMFVTSAFATPESKTSVKIHGTSSLGNKGDVIVITVPSENGTKKTYRGTLKGDHLDIDMGTTDNYFNVTKSGIVVSFENETTDETGTFLLLGKEGNGTHKPNNKEPESDNGMNNFDAANIVFDNANKDDMNNDQNKDDQQDDDQNKDDQQNDDLNKDDQQNDDQNKDDQQNDDQNNDDQNNDDQNKDDQNNDDQNNDDQNNDDQNNDDQNKDDQNKDDQNNDDQQDDDQNKDDQQGDDLNKDDQQNDDQNKDDQQNDDQNKDDQQNDDQNKDDQPVNNNSQNTTEKKENVKPSLMIRRKARNTITISDEEVPLANVPKTGDNTVMIMMVMLTAVIGMIAVAACKTRKATNI